MLNILIIGIGNIGLRHLEAIAKLDVELQVFIIDNDESRFRTLQGTHLSIKYGTKLEELAFDQIIDYCIVSTTSEKRASIIRDILKLVRVKTFILEKVLFQAIQDYDHIYKLLEVKNSEAFVNCPRRIMGAYEELKKKFINEQITKFEVRGGQWNMASNLIHFLDTLSFFLSDNWDILNLDGNGLTEIIDSKHNAYKEFLGEVNGVIGGVVFTASSENINRDLTVSIQTNSKKYVINESKQNLTIENQVDHSHTEETFRIDYVSDSTNRFIINHLNGNSGLPKYDISMRLHLALIEMTIKQQTRFFGENYSEKAKIT